MAIRNFLRDSKAVSPVIGVMLMVVVTVILAAAVSAYSSGVEQSESAPVGVFDCSIVKNDASMAGGITLRHISGDRIPTNTLTLQFVADGKMTEISPTGPNVQYVAESMKVADSPWDADDLDDDGNNDMDVKVVTNGITDHTNYVNSLMLNNSGDTTSESITLDVNGTGSVTIGATLASGSDYYFILDTTLGVYTYPVFTFNETVGSSDYEDASFVITDYTSPYHVVPGEMPNENTEHWFGNYTLAPGTTMKAGHVNNYSTSYIILGDDGVNTLISNWDDLTQNQDFVTVKIIHNPTNTVIWTSDVPVKG